jgi:hypothetical protein
MKTCKLAMVSGSAGGADVGGEDAAGEGAVGAEFGAVGFSAVTRAAIPAKTLPKSMGGGCVGGPGANRSFKAVKVLTPS